MSVNIKALKKRADVVAIIGSEIDLKAQGSAYVACCPFHGEKTPSFKLDDRQGEWLWKCFGCGKGGDIITWFEFKHSLTQAQAIEKLEGMVASKENSKWIHGAEQVKKNFTPINSESLGGKSKTTSTLAQWAPRVAALKSSEAGMNWLKQVRGLDDETITRLQFGYVQKHVYRIKEDLEHCREQGWICMPRIEGDKVVAVKFRSITEKAFSQVNNMDGRALFNIDSVSPLEPVYLTEGEMDAAVLEMAGFRAVSCPSANAELTTESRIKLKLAERVFLAGDKDGPGAEYMKKLLREFGENTHLLEWPDVKDANDFFRITCNRDVKAFRNQVKSLSKKAKDAPPEGFVPLLEQLRLSKGADMENDPNRLHFPPRMPLADGMTYTPRGGVVVLYSTYSGTGKSMLKTDILLCEAKRGEVVVDLSPEIRDGEYLSLVTSQIVGPTTGGLRRTGKMDEKYFLEAARILDEPTIRGTDFRYYVGYNVLGQTEEEVLAFLENTIRTLGATRFAIDTFHRLIFAEGKGGQTQAEGSMIKKIEALGNKYGTIFILICQSNAEAEGIDNLKRNEHGVLRGSREIRDVPAAIYLLHRNRCPQKDGANPEDILEKEAGLFAKKTRYKGPRFPQVKLLLQEENSLFVEGNLNQQGDPGPQAPPPGSSSWAMDDQSTL